MKEGKLTLEDSQTPAQEIFDRFANELVESSQRLCEHITTQSNSQDTVTWLMFGCKYIQKVVSIAENSDVDDSKINSVLLTLGSLESSLPV